MTFFKPWRRKLGVLTLMLACVFTAGWIRSLMIGDEVVRPTTQHIVDSVSSQRGFLCWDRFDYQLEVNATPFRSKWNHPRGTVVAPLSEIHWTFCSISWSEHQWGDHLETLLLIPYSSIVTPLTLLSAGLLLSKSRQKPATVPE